MSELSALVTILAAAWSTHLLISLTLWRRVVDLKDERRALIRRIDRLEREVHALERDIQRRP